MMMHTHWEEGVKQSSRLSVVGKSRSVRWARLILVAIVAGLLVERGPFTVGFAVAQNVSFQIDELDSFIRFVPGVTNDNADERFEVMDGTRIVKTVAIVEQSLGSLQTAVSGTLQGAVSGKTITFQGGSVIDAVQNPAQPFQPGSHLGPDGTGSMADEDNYGAFGAQVEPDLIVGSLALRDIVGDIVAGSATIGGPVSDLQFDITQGTLDFFLDVLDAYGSFNLPVELTPEVNQSAAMLDGSLDGTITIPLFLDFTFGVLDDDDSRLIVEGQIVAHRMAALAGDYNGNGLVEQGDLDLVLLNWGGELADPAKLGWTHDLPVGAVDQGELDRVLLGWGDQTLVGSGSFAVPEPATATTMLFACLASVIVCKKLAARSI